MPPLLQTIRMRWFSLDVIKMSITYLLTITTPALQLDSVNLLPVFQFCIHSYVHLLTSITNQSTPKSWLFRRIRIMVMVTTSGKNSFVYLSAFIIYLSSFPPFAALCFKFTFLIHPRTSHFLSLRNYNSCFFPSKWDTNPLYKSGDDCNSSNHHQLPVHYHHLPNYHMISITNLSIMKSVIIRYLFSCHRSSLIY